RSTDGSGATVTYTPGTGPGDWPAKSDTIRRRDGPWGHLDACSRSCATGRRLRRRPVVCRLLRFGLENREVRPDRPPMITPFPRWGSGPSAGSSVQPDGVCPYGENDASRTAARLASFRRVPGHARRSARRDRLRTRLAAP